MLLHHSLGRFAGRLFLAACVPGVAAALLGATHPAAAQALIAAAQSAVTCATTGTTPCESVTNTSSGIGIRGEGNIGTGVEGTSNTNYGIKSTSTGNYGIFGQSTNGFAGVAGTSPMYGVLGNGGAMGVYGLSSGAGFGVLGTDDNGIGVLGATSAINAVSAITGISGTGTGMDAFSESGIGVFAVGRASRAAVLAIGRRAFVGRAPSNGFPLRLTDSNGNVVFSVDGVGNVQFAGSFTTIAPTAAGTSAIAFHPQTTSPTLEDSGTAQLVGGTAVVRLDPSFAATIDARAGYRVALTPYGDTRGLYVAATAPDAFTVRESQGGTATLSFDYRILATPVGGLGRRMTIMKAAPRVSLPAIPHVTPHAIVAPIEQP